MGAKKHPAYVYVAEELDFRRSIVHDYPNCELIVDTDADGYVIGVEVLFAERATFGNEAIGVELRVVKPVSKS